MPVIARDMWFFWAGVLTTLAIEIIVLWNSHLLSLRADKIARQREEHAKMRDEIMRNSLRGANLSGRDMRGYNLAGASMEGCNLSQANLSGVDLRGTRLNGATLIQTVWGNAILRGAILEGAKLRQTSLADTDMWQIRLHGATYDESTFFPSDFDAPKAGAILVKE